MNRPQTGSRLTLDLPAGFRLNRRPFPVGGILKRSTRADCKSAGYAFTGSNPVPTTTFFFPDLPRLSSTQREGKSVSDSKAKQPGFGFVSGSGSSTSPNCKPKLRFVKVVDGRKQPIRGLWRRGGVFYARIGIRRADGTVRDSRIPLKGRTIATAKEELSALRKKNRESGLLTPQESPQLATYVPRYLKYADLSKRQRTAKLEAMHLRHWSRAVGSLKLDQIGSRHVLGFRTEKLADGWSKRSCNLSLVILRNLFRHAMEEGLVSSIPFVAIKSMKHVPQRRRLYTIEEIDTLCEAAIRSARFGQQLADYVRLMAFCGSRCEETLHLCWSDVDWEQEQLTVGSDGQTKNHESRTVDFNPSLAAHLRLRLMLLPCFGGVWSPISVSSAVGCPALRLRSCLWSTSPVHGAQSAASTCHI